MTSKNRAHGIDISKYNVSFAPEDASGQLDFVIQRLSYALREDEKSGVLSPAVQRVGVRGAYHYLSSGAGWRAQADFFLARASKAGIYHFYACDLETAYNNVNQRFVDDAWQFVHYVQAQTGQPCLLYTNVSLYNRWIATSAHAWDSVPLWLAQYWFFPSPDKDPGMPHGRNKWTFWQYSKSANGQRYGVGSRQVDVDVYNGDVAALRTWAGVDDAGGQPPDGGGPGPVVITVHTTLRVDAAGQAEIMQVDLESDASTTT